MQTRFYKNRIGENGCLKDHSVQTVPLQIHIAQNCSFEDGSSEKEPPGTADPKNQMPAALHSESMQIGSLGIPCGPVPQSRQDCRPHIPVRTMKITPLLCIYGSFFPHLLQKEKS